MKDISTIENRLLNTLHLQQEKLSALPPDIRAQLLTYAHIWGSPEDLLEIVDGLREAYGPLLFLLDYQAIAYFQQKKYEIALSIIERRQRRSTNIAGQILEARALLASGYESHVQAVADEISQAHARNVDVITMAATVYAGLGRFEYARDLLEAYLKYRPNDLQTVLTLIQISLQAEQRELADEYLQRLGSGIPSGISDLQLQELGTLLNEMELAESANAVQLELARRKQIQQQDLQTKLLPFTGTQGDTFENSEDFYRHLSGPESISVTKKEARSVKLEAVRHFGFTKLRVGQIETITSVLRGDSILTVMPTGAGKSLCYQLPALTLPRATLVISPLIALMKDQVESLPAAARQQATFINSTLEDEELEARMEGIAQGKYKLIYAAPERLRQRAFLHALRHSGLDLFVVDEAHCVSLWGHDFRPDYLFIQEARHALGDPPALAMTATAPPRVRDEIVDYMSYTSDASIPSAGLATDEAAPPFQVMTLDIFRDNLHLSNLRFNNEEEKIAALLKFVTENEGSGIVYVNTRSRSEMVAYQLQSAGVAAEAYHAGLADRGAVQDRFMGDKTRVVVATVAFGMGIDKSDIRFIVHFNPSRSLAAYYQEVGRAGRDGKPSQGVLFYSNNDWSNLRRWAKSDEYEVEFLEKIYNAIAAQLGAKNSIISEESDQEVIDATDADNQENFTHETLVGPVDGRRLQQVVGTDETTMRVSVSILERVDLLSRSFDFPREMDIGLPRKVSSKAKDEPSFMRLLKGLALRPGKSASFQTHKVAEFMDWPLHETENQLLEWQMKGYLNIKGSRRAMLVELPPRPEDMQIRLERLLQQSAAVAQRRIDDIIGYSTAETCRHGYISMHFGSPPRTKCEICDNCTGIRPDIPAPSEKAILLPDDKDIEPMIIDCLISSPKPVGRSGLARILAGSLRAPVKPHEARHHGALKGLGESTIMGYADALLDASHLRQYERSGYPVLAATVSGRTLAEKWLIEHPELAEMAPEPETPEGSEAGNGQLEPAESDKYTAFQKALWLWRRRTADEQGMPPYVIMSNELMLQIAETRPQDEEALAALPGMGKQRLQYYGPTILDLVKLHPVEDGDSARLEALRTEQDSAEADVKKKLQQQAQAVSPRIERRIYMKMQEMRQKKAIGQDLKVYAVASNTLLKAIAKSAPTTQAELEKLVGFRGSHLSEEAPAILEFIQNTLEEMKDQEG